MSPKLYYTYLSVGNKITSNKSRIITPKNCAKDKQFVVDDTISYKAIKHTSLTHTCCVHGSKTNLMLSWSYYCCYGDYWLRRL